MEREVGSRESHLSHDTILPCLSFLQDIWNRNVEQHHLFERQLDASMIYIRRCRYNLTPTPPPSPVPEPTPELTTIDTTEYNLDPSRPFSPTALRKHMDTYILMLAGHLEAEIDTLRPEYFEKMGEKAMKEVNAKAEKLMQIYDPAWFLCCAVGEWESGRYSY